MPSRVDRSDFFSLKTTLETTEFGSLRFDFHPLLAGIQAIRSTLFDQFKRNRPLQGLLGLGRHAEHIVIGYVHDHKLIAGRVSESILAWRQLGAFNLELGLRD